MVLIKRISKDLVQANAARLFSSLGNSDKSKYLSTTCFLNTNGFGHTGHFWATTYKPSTGRPKEYHL